MQIARRVKRVPINKDTLFIKQDSWRNGILESESTEIELTLANAVHQLDA